LLGQNSSSHGEPNSRERQLLRSPDTLASVCCPFKPNEQDDTKQEADEREMEIEMAGLDDKTLQRRKKIRPEDRRHVVSKPGASRSKAARWVRMRARVPFRRSRDKGSCTRSVTHSRTLARWSRLEPDPARAHGTRRARGASRLPGWRAAWSVRILQSPQRNSGVAIGRAR
jgi:hypothetical protein